MTRIKLAPRMKAKSQTERMEFIAIALCDEIIEDSVFRLIAYMLMLVDDKPIESQFLDDKFGWTKGKITKVVRKTAQLGLIEVLP